MLAGGYEQGGMYGTKCTGGGGPAVGKGGGPPKEKMWWWEIGRATCRERVCFLV